MLLSAFFDFFSYRKRMAESEEEVTIASVIKTATAAVQQDAEVSNTCRFFAVGEIHSLGLEARAMSTTGKFSKSRVTYLSEA